MAITAAVALDLSGPTRLQSRDAARGLELWAAREGVDLEIVDVAGSAARAVAAYEAWVREGVRLLPGPYGSGLVRRVVATVPPDVLLWNHGGADDDVARRGAPMVVAPASTYFGPLVSHAAAVGCDELTVVCGGGRFARTVAAGAVATAEAASLAVEVVELDSFDPGPGRLQAVLAVGRFEDDVAVVARLVGGERPRVVGCVAAGIPAFADAAGDDAEGVHGPTQWWPDGTDADVGPTAVEFAAAYTRRHSVTPSYVAAQAAAAGYLAFAAAERSFTAETLPSWSTSTLLGGFQVDGAGRQLAHRATMGRWSQGRFERVPPPR